MGVTSTSRPSWAFLAALLALALFAAGCQATFEEPPLLTAEDSGSTLVLQTGEEFTVQLESNPSTGYAWTLDGALPANVEQVGEPEYVAPGMDAVGAAGMDLWKFRATEAGTGEVYLRYWRSFDPETENEKTFTVEVTVREP